MLCPLELGEHPPCDGRRTSQGTTVFDDAGAMTIVLRRYTWECPICGTRWRSEEIATDVSTPESRGENA